MKFRTKLTKEGVNTLHNICQTLTKINTTYALYLSDVCVRIASVPTSSCGAQCFAELVVSELFLDYRIESQSVNTILFEINLDLLAKALVSGKNSPQSVLKLVRRDLLPTLCFEAQANDGMYVDVTHHIPINLLKPSDIVHYMPPEVPHPTICLELPKNRMMKTIFDRMSKFSKTIKISARQSGVVSFSVEGSSVEINSICTGLSGASKDGTSALINSDSNTSVVVEIKTLSQIFGVTMSSRSMLFIQENAAVVIHLTLYPSSVGSVTFYVPVMISEDESDC